MMANPNIAAYFSEVLSKLMGRWLSVFRCAVLPVRNDFVVPVIFRR